MRAVRAVGRPVLGGIRADACIEVARPGYALVSALSGHEPLTNHGQERSRALRPGRPLRQTALLMYGVSVRSWAEGILIAGFKR